MPIVSSYLLITVILLEYVLEESVHRVHHLVRLVVLILIVIIVWNRKVSPMLVIVTSYPLTTYGRIINGVFDIETVYEGLPLLIFRSVHILAVSACRRVAIATDFALWDIGLIILVMVLALDILIFLSAVNSVRTFAPEQKLQVSKLIVNRWLWFHRVFNGSF